MDKVLAAFTVVRTRVITLVTLASGAIILPSSIMGAGFLASGKPIAYCWLLYLSWGLLVFSILFGHFTLGCLVDALYKDANSDELPNPYNANVTFWGRLQDVLFALGGIALMVFLAFNL